jgi:periplasmic divalent cation tolerance protein
VSPYSIALTTVASEAKAREIARAALEARLAACVQIFPIQSHYVWRGELREDAELALHLKIRAEDFDAVQALIRRLHDYETPEILRIDIAEGDGAYLSWMDACLGKRAP